MERSIRLRLNDIIQAIDGAELTIGGIAKLPDDDF